jgi:hypothetical protein
MPDTIDTDAHYRQALRRAAALHDHCAALRAVQALASANRYLGAIEPEDQRDLAALDDVLADIGYALRCLEGDIADWEARQSGDTRDGCAADRAWHRRRTL